MRFGFLVLILTFFPAGFLKTEAITEDDLRGHIAVLASDLFEGREPGTDGENKTVNYIASKWSEAGLQPAVHGMNPSFWWNANLLVPARYSPP